MKVVTNIFLDWKLPQPRGGGGYTQASCIAVSLEKGLRLIYNCELGIVLSFELMH